MIANTNKDRGRVGLSLAIAYFGANGYTVSLPLNDTQWYDMIVEKDGIFKQFNANSHLLKMQRYRLHRKVVQMEGFMTELQITH